jgi:hypothetical protein
MRCTITKVYKTICTKSDFVVFFRRSWRGKVQTIWRCLCFHVPGVRDILRKGITYPGTGFLEGCLLFLSYADAAECWHRRLFVFWTRTSVLKPDRCLISNLHVQQNNVSASSTTCRYNSCPFIAIWFFLLQDKSVGK